MRDIGCQLSGVGRHVSRRGVRKRLVRLLLDPADARADVGPDSCAHGTTDDAGADSGADAVADAFGFTDRAAERQQ